MRNLYFLLLALTLSGCILAGEPEDSELRLSANTRYRIDDSTSVQLPFNIKIRSGRLDVNLTPTDLENGYSQAFPLDVHGKLIAETELLDMAGNVIATNNTSFDLQPDLLLSISFFITKGNPLGGCWGCWGSTSSPLGHLTAFEPSDSLSIVWGMSSKNNPVQY